MRTPIRLPGRTRFLSPLAAAALTASLLVPLGAATPVAASPAHQAAAPAPAPAAPGPVTGTSCSPACDLYAGTGTLTLPDATTVPIYGYSTTSGAASLPGPVLVVNQGDPVAITLHNVDLPSATSLMISGQPAVPDTSGVTAGNSTTYSFPATGAGALQPGTYLYEAGLTPDGPRQAAMGLYGALIVRPTGAPLQAYAGADTTFADEAVLVLSEIDPAFNAAPLTFDLNYVAPKYWLINGKGYPNTDPIGSAAGNSVLLRYVNAGLQTHSMSLLGLHQTIVATDAQPATNPTTVVAETVPTGGTLDTLVTMPASPPADAKFAVFDGAMHEDNNGVRSTAAADSPIAFGGMLTFVTMTGASTPAGPVTSAVSLSPNPSNGTAAVTLGATISGSPDQAEYFVDALGASGTGCPITGSLTSVNVTIPVSGATAPCADLSLASGNHAFYVRGHDANGWGAASSAVLNLDKTGPAISNMSLTPSLDNGTADVALQATASDVATGNQNVTAAEYSIDGGATTAFTVAPATTVSLSATIPAATVNGLSEGAHSVAVRAQDALGNWGALGTATLTVDKTGPGTSGVTVQPNPNNGTLGVQVSSGGAFYVRIDATIADTASNVVAAEYFIDTVGADGTGGAMFATDGVYSGSTEHVYGAAELFAIAALASGNHTISVHGRDAAGNWGPTSTTTLTIDKAAPTTSGVTVTPPASNNSAVTVGASASDVATGGSNIAGGELFIDTAGANGSGIAMSAAAAAPATTISGTIPAATVAGLAAGVHTILVHSQDVAGNWGATASGSLLIDRTPPTFTGITLVPASTAAGTASVTLNVNGAIDPVVLGGASGVAGGEWWFGTTNPANGGGTAFTGLTTSIPTSCLAPGTYTVRARIRDAAGNWSTGATGVRSATLTITGAAAAGIFCDGFEAPNVLPGNWSSRSTATGTRLGVSAAAALTGAWGLAAQGNNTNYLQYNFGTPANPAAATYDARFYFQPNSNNSAGKDILSAASTTAFTTIRYRVRYRLSAGQGQVQIQVGTANTNTTWTNVNNATANVIETVWQSGTTLRLYVNGSLAQTLTAPAGSVGAVRLGSVTATGTSTLMYFDAFASKRTASPLWGP